MPPSGRPRAFRIRNTLVALRDEQAAGIQVRPVDGDEPAAVEAERRELFAFYRAPDLALVDGRIGMKGSHLSGVPCNPQKRVLVGGRNPWAVDARAAWLLGWSWEQIGHLRATRPLFFD